MRQFFSPHACFRFFFYFLCCPGVCVYVHVCESDGVIGCSDDGFPVQPSDPPQMDTQQDYGILRN